jgi:hypothetical protein
MSRMERRAPARRLAGVENKLAASRISLRFELTIPGRKRWAGHRHIRGALLSFAEIFVSRSLVYDRA